MLLGQLLIAQLALEEVYLSREASVPALSEDCQEAGGDTDTHMQPENYSTSAVLEACDLKPVWANKEEQI